ncbi:hypothetical protein, variant [Saprolegnia diclina VS20]|uniref:Uncharacterized protein n=1 Tax=Saprolegnia diclina (strain VS20) TaxID=1156394 RepID=T0PW54_SAPDV|nr:hypothetical protein SDRG_12525 [Saprolegnia diclina VS20]XP_008616820.1 hypothetical protein, variant [Saprolegnia diclina VS20]EQC29753.1 hypothetical protein SDRG_12525 [Saprolegnia diclina VS20]EQC29754.1 hypothetical protein, variant [Saprolegnia diclina VS20]|eukprot:XP_008616819.1 hypothetical protein SDRG_12525 [Saprolegnia diclina VS20]
MPNRARRSLPDERKRHVAIIARLLHESAAKSSLPPHQVGKTLLRLAVKMENQLYTATHGRALTDDAIRKHLVFLATRACSKSVL